jgi:hypothetical protein
MAVANATYEPPAPPPPPKSLLDRSHDMLGLHLGVGGTLERKTDSTSVSDAFTDSRDLAATYGVNFRADFPVVRYILLGPMLDLIGAWRPDVDGLTRDYYTDFDFYLRGRVPIDMGAMGAQFWVGVPIGLSLSFLGADSSELYDGFGFGWNVGVMLGGAIHFTKKFGLYVEAGWMQHKLSHASANDGGPDTTLTLSQTIMNTGFVF